MSAGRAPESMGLTGVNVFAPAKINLFLHAGEKRPDGYHALESLIAFAEVADRIQIEAAAEFSLSVSGPFEAVLPKTEDNIVLRAARALGHRAGVERGAAIRLEKNLPVAAGIGGGSADAAAVLRGLKLLWQLDQLDLFPLAAELGSDVPACLLSRPCWVEGRGEIITALPPLPRLSTVLVNPGVALSTAAVFAALNMRSGTGAIQPAKALESLWDVIGYLGDAGNDLEAPACQLAPVIQEVLSAFDREPGCALAAMSGSGSTCFAFFHEHDFARGAAEQVSRIIRIGGFHYAACWSGCRSRRTNALINAINHESSDIGQCRFDGAVRAGVQRILRGARIAARTVDSFGKRSPALQEFYRVRKSAFVLNAEFDRFAPESAFVIARARERQDDRQGHFRLPENRHQPIYP